MTLTYDRLRRTSAVAGYVWSLAAALLASWDAALPPERHPANRTAGLFYPHCIREIVESETL